MTDGIRSVMQEMTGVFIPGCPWRAFTTAIVREVMSAIQFFESGNLVFGAPEPSHRLVEGIRFWNQTYNQVVSKQMKNERLEREAKEAANPPAQRRRRRG